MAIDTPASSPTSTAPGQTSSATDQTLNTRPGLTLAATADKLAPLTDLSGTWFGTGLNVMSLPDFDSTPPSTGPAPFRVKLNSTVEVLEFTPIGGSVPNRGSSQGTTGQKDISIFGLRYLQRIADQATNEALHVEPGFWLTVPATDFPVGGPTVVRLATIPHGNALCAVGTSLQIDGGPRIAAGDTTPVHDPAGEPPLGAGYLAPFDTVTLPAGFKPGYVKNPNLALSDAISGQNITHTTVLFISTAAPANGPETQLGGIVSMPFDLPNANPTRMDAIFWIETVQQPGAQPFLQLQYTQTVILEFLDISWPHISVATLVKQ